MSDDWKPGDAAWCIRKGKYADVPRVGQAVTVEAVCYNKLFFSDAPNEGPHWHGHRPQRFRKIKPHTPDAEDAEVIALMNGAGVKEASDA